MRRVLILIFILFCGLGCSSKDASKVVSYEVGLADLYDFKDHNSKRVLDNRLYNRNEFTAAHGKMPRNARLKVTNLGNGRRTEVMVNDQDLREDCLIKLSDAAARELKISAKGKIKVSVEMVGYGAP